MADARKSTTVSALFKTSTLVKRIILGGTVVFAFALGVISQKEFNYPNWLALTMLVATALVWPINMAIWRWQVFREEQRLRANLTPEELALYDDVCTTDTVEGLGRIHNIMVDAEKRSPSA